MPIDFSEIDIDAIMDDAAEKTDEKLSNQISSLTRMRDDEIQELFPSKGDAKKLVELMRVVNSAQADNEKANRIVENSEKFAGVIVTLLKNFVV